MQIQQMRQVCAQVCAVDKIGVIKGKKRMTSRNSVMLCFRNEPRLWCSMF